MYSRIKTDVTPAQFSSASCIDHENRQRDTTSRATPFLNGELCCVLRDFATNSRTRATKSRDKIAGV